MAEDVDLRRKAFKILINSITLTNNNTSPLIDMQVWAGGGFIVTSLTGAASINYFVAAGTCTDSTTGTLSAGTFGALHDSTDAAVTQNLTSGDAYSFPDGCFPFPFVQLRTNAGTAVIQLVKKT